MKSAIACLKKEVQKKKANIHVYLSMTLKSELDKICNQNKLFMTELVEAGLRYYVSAYIQEKRS